MKIKQKLMILMCISALFLSACNSGGAQSVGDNNDVVQTQSTTVLQETDITKFTNDQFDGADLYEDWSKSKTTIITINDLGISHDGTEDSGIKIEGKHITISKAGDFAINGVCEDGSITVDCDQPGIVRIIMDNCSMTNQSGSALHIEKAEKVVVTASFETSNLLADGTATDDKAGAAVYSKENLTFNGSGTMTIYGNRKDAVVCDKNLKFTSGTYNINGKDNGVVASQGITLKNGCYNLQSNGAGFKTTSTNDAEGYIGIETGSYSITSGGNALEAKGSIYYLNGSLALTTGAGATLSDGIVAKGLKAGGNFEMYGGSAQIQSVDDAVYANGSVKIATGCLNASAGDDGIVAGENIEILGGSIVLSQCVEGFESNGVSLTGGFIDINATSDGINVCGGNDGSAKEERVGINDFERSGEGEVTISQTCINIKSDADAIDVVGSLTVESGAAYIRGGQAEGNNSIDCSKDYIITSGNVNAAGVESEVITPSDASKQNTVVLEYSDVQNPGTVACIKNSKDELIACFSPASGFTKAVISKPEFKDGEKYSWYTATIKEDAVTKYGEIVSEDVNLGDKIADFTVEKGVTIVK